MQINLAASLASFLQDTTIEGVAVGLSGGSDSWALALLAHEWCAQHDIPFIALTVDHRLRPESNGEAQSVAAECATRNIPHHILTWDHAGIDSRKQERARTARYELMGSWCAANDFTHLLVAHHADDQAETVLMRFAKGSGSTGLAGMSACRPLNDTVTLLRPLLGVRKADLLAHAEAAGVPITHDPSNVSPAYARGRLRASAAALAAEGLTTDILLSIATHARADRKALQHAAQKLILDHLQDDTLPAEVWTAAPPALQQVAWLNLWRRITGSAAYPPERVGVEALCAALAAGPVRRTLGGMISERKTTKYVDILRFKPERVPENPVSNIVS